MIGRPGTEMLEEDSLVTTMKAAVLRRPDAAYEIDDVRLGELRPDEVLVRIAGAGMCHTDMLPRDADGGLAGVLPVVLGHEGSGVVESVGPAVHSVRTGDHVVLSFDSCGHCAPCLQASPAYCLEFELRNLTGRRSDGSASAQDRKGEIANRWFGQSSFAEYAIATARNVVVVDPDLPLELLGPLGCGVQTGAGAVLNEMRLSPGQSIAVFGAGAVGLSAVMAARVAGAAEIVVVDLHDSRLQLALECGATRIVRGDAPDLADAVRGAGEGVDYFLDTTAVPAVMAAAIAALSRQGKGVFVGAGSGRLDIAPWEFAGKTLTYVFEGSAVPQIFLPRLIRLWRQGHFPFDKLIRTYPLAQINDAEADSVSGVTIKPVLIPE